MNPMTLRGHIRNGVVVLQDPCPLADGTPVSVEPLLTPETPAPDTGAALLETLRHLGPFEGDPAEWDALLADLPASKQLHASS